MNKYKFYTALMLLLVSACTQVHAPVVLKGQESFTRSGTSTNGKYASQNSDSFAPPAEDTHQEASVDSVGVSDLAPPPMSKQKSGKLNSKPEPEAKIGITSTNPWTHKPRDLEGNLSVPTTDAAPLASEIKAEGKQEAKLEAKSLAAPEKSEVKSDIVSGAFKWPVASNKIVSTFGTKGKGVANDGINIAANNGEPVTAAAGGEVVYVGNNMNGYGNMVIIKHAGNKSTSYAHLGRATVDKYSRVQQGDIIGYVGTTGDVKTPQLFFALRDGKQAIDPTKYMSN